MPMYCVPADAFRAAIVQAARRPGMFHGKRRTCSLVSAQGIGSSVDLACTEGRAFHFWTSDDTPDFLHGI